MKYPSVFLTILLVWMVIATLAISLKNTGLTFNLYLAAMFFSVITFFIGFWRNQ
jgi:hypothetical protein